VSVNDPWVMDAWSRDQGADGKVLMLADGNAEFATAMDLVQDSSRAGMGVRSRRYAAVIEDGVITSLDVDEPGSIVASTCEVVLGKV
jgi:glutaredoxin/glutathione-dependent peroxiredoxin